MFPNKGWALRTLQRVVRKIKSGEETNPGRRPGGGRRVQDPTLLEKASALLNSDGDTISLGVAPLARRIGCTRKQARCVVKKLNLKSVAKVKGSRMSDKNRADRKNFAEYALMRMGSTRNPMRLETIWFSDEKTFTAEPRRQGTRNDRVLIPQLFYAANCNFRTIFSF